MEGELAAPSCADAERTLWHRAAAEPAGRPVLPEVGLSSRPVGRWVFDASHVTRALPGSAWAELLLDRANDPRYGAGAGCRLWGGVTRLPRMGSGAGGRSPSRPVAVAARATASVCAPRRMRARARPRTPGCRVGAAGAPPRTGPGHHSHRGVDVRRAAGRAQRGPDHPRFERRRNPLPISGRSQAQPASDGGGVDAGHGGLHPRQPAGTRDVRCGTGSAPTPTWRTRPTPGWAISRCSGGTFSRAG